MNAGKKNGIKILYGMEGYLLNDDDNEEFLDIDGEYVVFDLETTGLKAEQGHIIEVGAVKIINGEIVDRFSTCLLYTSRTSFRSMVFWFLRCSFSFLDNSKRYLP